MSKLLATFAAGYLGVVNSAADGKPEGRRLMPWGPFDFGTSPPEGCEEVCPGAQCLWDDANALNAKFKAVQATADSDVAAMWATSPERTSAYCHHVNTIKCISAEGIEGVISDPQAQRDACDPDAVRTEVTKNLINFMKGGLWADSHCDCDYCPGLRMMNAGASSVADTLLGIFSGQEPDLPAAQEALCPYTETLTCIGTNAHCAERMQHPLGLFFMGLNTSCAALSVDQNEDFTFFPPLSSCYVKPFGNELPEGCAEECPGMQCLLDDATTLKEKENALKASGMSDADVAVAMGEVAGAACLYKSTIECFESQSSPAVSCKTGGQMEEMVTFIKGAGLECDSQPSFTSIHCAPTSTATNTSTGTTTKTSSFTMTETGTMTMTGTMTVTDTETTLPITSTSLASEETTLAEEPIANVVEVTLTLTVEDPTTITEDETLTTAMIAGFAEVMGVDTSQVTLEFQLARRLKSLQSQRERKSRKLQVTLLAIFSVTLPTAEEAEEAMVAIEAVKVEDTNAAISDAMTGAGFTGTIEVTGKEATIPEPEMPSKASCTLVMQNIFISSLVVMAVNL